MALLPVGFAVPACCQARGALLPHHFTLATHSGEPFGGIFLLHFPSARAAQALPGTVPCGARTFLGTPEEVTRLSGRLRRGHSTASAMNTPESVRADADRESLRPNRQRRSGKAGKRESGKAEHRGPSGGRHALGVGRIPRDDIQSLLGSWHIHVPLAPHPQGMASSGGVKGAVSSHQNAKITPRHGST